MNTKSFKKCEIVFAVLLCALHSFAEATLASGVDLNTPAIYCVSNHVEVLVRTLQLLTESTEWIQKRLERADAGLKYARPSAQQWHKRVLSSAFQPPPDAKTVFLKAIAGQADTIETRWNYDQCILTSVQTASRLFIMVSPKIGGTGTTLTEKHGNAKELSLRLFAESTVRRTGQGDGRVISNLAARITDGLFSSTTQLIIRDKEYACGGFSVSNDTKTKASASNEKFSLKEIDESNDENQWMASTFRAHYWFGNIAWWNNGATIVFYILKTDGRPPELYDHSIDEGWFSPSTRFRRKQDSDVAW